ncbi:hypothetical protein RCH14_003068 [Massilia sp. MP_M2]|uniref:thermostable hemolysin n=1 Tax=Massilia sp. MP_M2 TaxID=3071713 RepID=UPI00319DA098
MSTTMQCATRASATPPAASGTGRTLELVAPNHPERASLEAFIATEFARVYGATLEHFCHTLAGCRDSAGRWVAALGYTLAGEGPLFLEQYLECPVETEIGARTGRPVARAGIVEVGNLASTDAGAARALIVAMTHQLHCQGLVWVTFTATRALLNSFARLRLAPSVLADADPARLGQAQGAWGSYYATHPQVMFGNIGFGHDQLAR